MPAKETKVCETCGEEFEVGDEPEDCFECPKCRKADIDPEEEFDSYELKGR